MSAPPITTFRQLHASGCFVLPNPWDIGSARLLAQLGFSALATSSAGFAFSRGLPDTVEAVGRDQMLAHIAEIVAATTLPINADFQNGYADDPDAVAANVRRCVATGVAGLSIEDATGRADHPLYDRALATERIAAARAAIDASGSGVLLTARAECFLVGHTDPLAESMARLRAYAEAGADVLFAPGMYDEAAIRATVEVVAPKPVNILIGRATPLGVADLARFGVRRISVGSALARAAWAGFLAAANEIARDGTFAGFDGLPSVGEMSRLLAP